MRTRQQTIKRWKPKIVLVCLFPLRDELKRDLHYALKCKSTTLMYFETHILLCALGSFNSWSRETHSLFHLRQLQNRELYNSSFSGNKRASICACYPTFSFSWTQWRYFIVCVARNNGSSRVHVMCLFIHIRMASALGCGASLREALGARRPKPYAGIKIVIFLAPPDSDLKWTHKQ